MLFNIFKSELDLSTNVTKIVQNKSEKAMIRFANVLIFSAAFGLYFPNTQAANISCTWTGGALDTGNWTDSNWNTDAACSGIFPNNNGDTFDATHPRGSITLDRDITIDAFNLAGGTLTGSNNLTVNKTFNWSRGTVSGTGSIRAAGGLELNGNLTFKDSATVINSAGQAANWSQGNIIMFNGESGFVNEAGANFIVTADDGKILVLGQGAKFDNDGVLVANLSSADSTVTINSQMNNRGLVGVQAGELQLGGGGTSSGSFVAAEQGKINFRGEHVLQAGSSVTGSSVVFSQLGTTSIEGTYNVVSTEFKPGGKANFDAEAASFTETLTMSGGDLSGTGTGALLVTGDATFSSGQMSGSGQTIVGGKLDFNGNFAAIRDDRVLLAAGPQANWTDGTILLRDEGSALIVGPSTTFKIQADKGRLFGKGVLGNQGVLEVDLADGAEPVVIKSNVTNFGSLILQGDNLLIGSATGGGDVINPFDSELTLFNGNFIQGETGTTFIDIAGNISGEEFDVLNVFESAFLDGMFDISLNFNPTDGDFFDILTAKTIVDSGLSLSGFSGELFDFAIVDLDSGNQALRLSFSPSSAFEPLSPASPASPVPIPATAWLFLSGLIGVWRSGIRQSK